MSRLMTSTALAAVMLWAGGQAAIGGSHSEMFKPSADPHQIFGSEFIGMRVYAVEGGVEEDESAGAQDGWEHVGEINDIILTRDGSVEAVLVDVGGFLGIGERQVAMDMSNVKFVSDGATEDEHDFFLVIPASRADLEGAPEFSADEAMAEMEREGEEAVAAVEEGAESAAEETSEVTKTVKVEVEEAGEETEQAAENVAAATEEAAEETEQAAENVAEATEEAAEATEMAAEEAVNETAEAVEETEMAAEEVAEETEQVAKSAEAEVEEGLQPMRDPFEREGYALAAPDTLTTDDLTGARVYDANDEWIGEIDELTVTEEGQIEMAIIDVGGFLGIGEKPVAMEMDKLDILREENGTSLRVYVAATKEELEAMPSYED